MSDPLSVAGTAVGITSLGIQVCQGFISYLESIKGRKGHVAESLREIQTIISIFYSLNSVLSRFDERRSGDLAGLRQCLRDCERKLQELQSLLIKLRGPDLNTSTKGRVAETRRSLIYPFREAKLKSLQHSLHDLLNILNLAISTASLSGEIHYDRNIAIGSAIEMMGTNLEACREEANSLHDQMRMNLGRLKEMENNITDTLSGLSQKLDKTEWLIQDLDQNVNAKLSLIQTDTQANTVAHQLTAENINQLLQMTKSNSEWLSRMALQISQVSPLVAQTPCDESDPGMYRQYGELSTGSISTPINQVSELSASRNTPSSTNDMMAFEGPICTCPYENQSFKFGYRVWNIRFQFEQREPKQHRPNCKFYGILAGANRIIKGQLPLKMAWFSSKISMACFELRTGTSSPGLSVRYINIVPTWCSPVANEIANLSKVYQNSHSRTEIIRQLESSERNILTMYREGKASPRDRDEHGQSHAKALAHIFIGNINLALLLGNPTNESTVNGSLTAPALKLLTTFASLVGADENIELDFTIPVLSLAMTSAEETRNRFACEQLLFISSLLGLFSYELDDSSFSVSFPLLKDLPSLRNLMDAPPHVHAIMSQSIHGLDRCIRDNPRVIVDQFKGFTTVHLCSSWPQGLRRVLSTGAKHLVDIAHSEQHKRPIQYAIESKCVESVNILMDAGCHIQLDRGMGGVKSNPIPIDLHGATKELVKAFALRLSQRRRTLLELAQREIGVLKDVETFDIADGKVVDLCKRLPNFGISVDQSLRVDWPYETIFHSPSISIDHFPIFFEAGFRDYNSRNFIGLTPVMINRRCNFNADSIATFSWLQNRGFLDQYPEDRLGVGLNVRVTGWHYFASTLGSGFFWIPFRDMKYHQATFAWEMIEQLSKITHRDCCICWCNPKGRGCSPLSLLWKSIAGGVGSCFDSNETYANHALLHHGINGSTIETNSRSEWLVELVQLLTFEALEMKHTCCSIKSVRIPLHLSASGVRDQNDQRSSKENDHQRQQCKNHHYLILNHDQQRFHKIRSTKLDHENSRQLDALMEDFVEQIRHLPASPYEPEQFIWGYWRQRISELYAVDNDVLGEMQQQVDNLETHVIPTRLQSILGKDFVLCKDDSLNTQQSSDTLSDDDTNDDDASDGDSSDSDATSGDCSASESIFYPRRHCVLCGDKESRGGTDD